MEIKQKRYSNRTGEDERSFTIDQSAIRNLVVEEADVMRALRKLKPRAKGPKELCPISLHCYTTAKWLRVDSAFASHCLAPLNPPRRDQSKCQ